MRIIDADELLRRLNNAIEWHSYWLDDSIKLGMKYDKPDQMDCMRAIRDIVAKIAEDLVEPGLKVLECTDDGIVVRITGSKLDQVSSVSIYMKGDVEDED